MTPLERHRVGEFVAEVLTEVDENKRLPDWPFRKRSGHVRISEWGQHGGGLGPVLRALTEAYHDEHVTVAVLEPEPDYYERSYAHAGAFRTDAASLPDRYVEQMFHEPSGDPTGALFYTARVLGITGSSHQWAVWGQQDWELVLLLTPDGLGPWLDAGIPFLGPREALDTFSPPRGWGHPTSDAEAAAFVQNIDQRL
jgi:hypothetical protein